MNPVKILIFLRNSDKHLMDIPISDQKELLNRMGPGKNDEDRSFKQFRGHHLMYYWWKEVIVEIGSFFVFPFFLMFCGLKHLADRKTFERVDAAGDFNNFFEIVPDSLRKEYDINNDHWNKGFFLSLKEIRYLLLLFLKYPIPCFVLKVAIKMAYYKYVIVKHSPRAIIVHNEASYTSSIITSFCNKNGVMHINVMHGEKLYYIGDGYFRFNRCYVWSEYYKQLFISMNAEESQFIIELPLAMKINTEKYFKQNLYSDFKYYLQNYDENQLLSIIDSLQFIKRIGKTIKFRPHPRGTNLDILEKLVPKEQIEYPKEVSIMESIASTSCAIGSFSTVQNQAFYSGKLTIFDDVTYKQDYQKLKEYGYFFSNMPHNRLSTFVDDTLENYHEIQMFKNK